MTTLLGALCRAKAVVMSSSSVCVGRLPMHSVFASRSALGTVVAPLVLEGFDSFGEESHGSAASVASAASAGGGSDDIDGRGGGRRERLSDAYVRMLGILAA